MSDTKLGTFLSDGNGRTLYLFTNDERSKSNCTGACAETWPPLLTLGAPTAGPGLTSGLLGTIDRSEGTKQVTFNGWPLYTYSKDPGPGQASGQSFGNTWFVVSNFGGPIQNGAPVKIVQNPTLGGILGEGSGRTLYLYTRDEKNKTNCTGGCAETWPPVLTVGAPVAVSGATAGLLGTITRPEGGIQVTYNTWPVYYFAPDVKPGDANGEGSGNVWFVMKAGGEAVGTPMAKADDVVVIALSELSNSTQSGTAVLTAKGDKTEVVLTLNAGPTGVAQPVHIHDGSCSTLGGVVYPLTNVVNGRSTTTVTATLASLRTGKFAINLHKSAADIATYNSCGDIPAASASVTIALGQVNGFPQWGFATLIAAGDKIMVNLAVTPGVRTITQPVHIHDGACATLGGVKYPLTNVNNGFSNTNVTATLASLQTGKFAINLHRSAQDIATYTACGDIPAVVGAASAPATTTPATVQADISNFALPSLNVKAGTTVTWTNRDGASHTSTGVGGAWNSGMLGTGKAYSQTFKQAGTFSYFCEFHANMKATVTVTDATTMGIIDTSY